MARIGASGDAGPGLRKDPLSWPEILIWGGLKTWQGPHKPKFKGYDKNIELFLKKDFQAGQVLGMKAGFQSRQDLPLPASGRQPSTPNLILALGSPVWLALPNPSPQGQLTSMQCTTLGLWLQSPEYISKLDRVKALEGQLQALQAGFGWKWASPGHEIAICRTKYEPLYFLRKHLPLLFPEESITLEWVNLNCTGPNVVVCGK